MCPIPISNGPHRLGPPPASAPVANDVVYDDESTVCSESEAGSDWDDPCAFLGWVRQEEADTFAVEKGEENKPAYEAYNFVLSPERKELVSGTVKMFGFKRYERHRTFPARVSRDPQPAEQSDLAEIHLRSIKEFQDKHRRSWVGRMLLGNAKTYEQHLDERCNKLPVQVQGAINALLEDRGKATSTNYRTRTWTVVSLKEQQGFRFAQTDLPEVNPRKNRFWKKNKGIKQPVVYSVVVQARETKVCSNNKGVQSFNAWENPWATADIAEARRKTRDRCREIDNQRAEEREARRAKRMPSPPSYRSERERSASPPSYRSPRTRYSSPPRYRVREVVTRARSRSVESLSVRIRRYRSQSPPPQRIRVQRRECSPDSVDDRWTSPFNRDPFSAPTPPECYTPPPAVSAYSRPLFPPPPMPQVQPFQRFPPPPSVLPPPGPFPAPAVCRACQTVPCCGHFPRIMPCPRPLQPTYNGIATHPPCYHCFGFQGPVPGSPPLSPSFGSFPPPPPPMPMAMPPPRPPFGTFARPIWPVPAPMPGYFPRNSSLPSSRSSSRSSSPSPSHVFGWRKPQVEDCNDELNDPATELPADDVSVIEEADGSAVGDQAPELVRATSPSLV
ncbi:hypothetical protein QBC38DRAFT_457111 [Podospora fimiseda]|uniref:Uncharacterized protein n=1 Tax=Podospora fimiseda TaxID=252190 RepID=A0AAN7BLE5_9PEZI|nr:hypothetical protein QBC38DRAFT_457111 [Podospora fimiseda]